MANDNKRVNWVVVRPCGCLCYAASIGNGPEDQDLRNEVARFVRKGEDVRQMSTEDVRASSWGCDVCKPNRSRCLGREGRSMNAFEWQGQTVKEMKCLKRKTGQGWTGRWDAERGQCWSDREYCDSDMALLEAKEKYFLKCAADAGFRAIITLQLPDDERKVRLLKDGQPIDEIKQCYSCIHGDLAFVEPPNYEDIFCGIGHDMTTCRDCCDWKRVDA